MSQKYEKLKTLLQELFQLGDASLARTFYQALLEFADGGTRQPALKEAQHYVAQRQ